MASVTMTTSLFGRVNVLDRPSVNRRGLVVAKAAAKAADGSEPKKLSCASNDKTNNTRRDMMFAAAAVAVSSIVGGSGIAIADEPKPGTPEAKKIYAPVCVTMPTAKICHK